MATRIAIVGLGRLGYEHARNIHYNVPDAELVAICSVRQEELDRVRDEIEPELVTQSFDELLEWGKFDGLVIATNSQTHAELICQAADNGTRAIYTEKPIGMSMEELDRIKASVQVRSDLTFQVGYNHRFDRDMAAAKQKIEAGYVGKPVLIRLASRDQKGLEEFIVKFSPTSGGLVADMMTHDYDTARWLTGGDAKRIFGLGDVYAFDGLKEVNDIDNAVILMEFTDGTMVQVEASRTSSYGYHAPFEIFGTDGTIKIGENSFKNRSMYLDKTGVNQACTEWFFEYWEETYLAEMADFVACIRENREPKVGLEDGYKAVEWAFAAAEAVRNKSAVDFKSTY
ncbi:MAG: Gfo/Idh/MocA family oxidoreductase [Spirochaeta sp.]|jgi:myo-inositol 2-dehydrogenase/D-chiro-inositol 1-dehydrogenase|nr:Gfo/Idh/MocA family oxidoreductase [Spirochaeta sp.]